MRRRVSSLLDSVKISQAISEVEKMLELAGLINLISKLETIRQTYKYMLHYLLDGTPDASRNYVLADISSSLMSYADLAVREVQSRDSSDYYYSLLRFNKLRKEKLDEIIKDYGNAVSELTLADEATDDNIELRRRMESDLSRLFDSLLISIGNKSEYDDLSRYILSGYADDNVAAQSVSALTLSLLMFYDRDKFNTLADIYENSENSKLKARALVGIVMAMLPDPERIRRDAKLMKRLSLWQDSLETYRNLQLVVKSIVGTLDTERIASKMRDEVIPELMKLRPEIIKKIRENNGELDAAMMGDNPEWEEILENSNLSKKLQELNSMQNDGADMMMVTFANLKQFPFFKTAANWFLPFESRHTSLNLGDDMKNLIYLMLEAGQIVCDSDLYSLALAAANIPEAQKNMMTNQLSANLDQIKEEIKEKSLKSSAPEFDKESVKVVRDLYRFFKLFAKRDGFFNPFAQPLQFRNLPVIGEMLSDEDNLRLFGEFYFKRGYYSDALPLLEALSAFDHEDATLWEKIGFCYQSDKNFVMALDAYNKASLLRVPGPWLTSKLAYVNRRLGNYREAAEYYSKALEMDPDNISLIMNAGNMQLESGDLSAATGHFYHALYLQSDNQKILRAVAWVELLNGNFSKSSDYYTRIMQLDAEASDYLNAGHAALLSGNVKEAANFYGISASRDSDGFERAFMADMSTLTKLGADETTTLLLLDHIMSNNQLDFAL